MSHKTPQTGKEFVQLAEKSDRVRRIREGKGSHVVIEFDDGTSVTVPVHGGRQLGTGIRHKLLNVFKAAGVLLLLVIILLIALLVFGVL